MDAFKTVQYDPTKPRKAAVIKEEVWMLYKVMIVQMYDEGIKKDEILRKLQATPDRRPKMAGEGLLFKPTMNQLTTQMDLWGLHRYNTSRRRRLEISEPADSDVASSTSLSTSESSVPLEISSDGNSHYTRISLRYSTPPLDPTSILPYFIRDAAEILIVGDDAHRYASILPAGFESNRMQHDSFKIGHGRGLESNFKFSTDDPSAVDKRPTLNSVRFDLDYSNDIRKDTKTEIAGGASNSIPLSIHTAGTSRDQLLAGLIYAPVPPFKAISVDPGLGVLDAVFLQRTLADILYLGSMQESAFETYWATLQRYHQLGALTDSLLVLVAIQCARSAKTSNEIRASSTLISRISELWKARGDIDLAVLLHRYNTNLLTPNRLVRAETEVCWRHWCSSSSLDPSIQFLEEFRYLHAYYHNGNTSGRLTIPLLNSIEVVCPDAEGGSPYLVVRLLDIIKWSRQTIERRLSDLQRIIRDNFWATHDSSIQGILFCFWSILWRSGGDRQPGKTLRVNAPSYYHIPKITIYESLAILADVVIENSDLFRHGASAPSQVLTSDILTNLFTLECNPSKIDLENKIHDIALSPQQSRRFSAAVLLQCQAMTTTPHPEPEQLSPKLTGDDQQNGPGELHHTPVKPVVPDLPMEAVFNATLYSPRLSASSSLKSMFSLAFRLNRKSVEGEGALASRMSGAMSLDRSSSARFSRVTGFLSDTSSVFSRSVRSSIRDTIMVNG